MNLRKSAFNSAVLGVTLWFILLSQTLVSAAQNDTGEFQSWHWKMGLDERLRWEYKHDFDFNERREDNGSLFFHRLKASGTVTFTDEYLKEKAVIFAEGLDAQTGGYQLKPQATQVDNFDFHQGYLQLFNILGSGIDLKGGRMEAKYGNGRLIAQPAWSNRMRHFDGGILHFARSGGFMDVLYLQDVKYDDKNFNRSSGRELLTGLYGGYQQHKMATLYELYILPQIITTGSSAIDRYTVGTRLKGFLPYQVSWEVEFPYQFGTSGTKDIRAHALNVSLDKGWETAWKPKVYFEYNQASGDDSSTDGEINTFMPLYQSTHDPYGLLDYFRWQNMREVASKFDISPFNKWKITPQMNFFWLENKNDSWYGSSGNVIRNKITGNRGYYVGQEVSLRAFYEINKNLKWESGYAHFFTGEYVKDSGAHDDTDWVYSQISFKY